MHLFMAPAYALDACRPWFFTSISITLIDAVCKLKSSELTAGGNAVSTTLGSWTTSPCTRLTEWFLFPLYYALFQKKQKQNKNNHVKCLSLEGNKL